MPGMNGIELGIAIGRNFPSCKLFLFSGQAATAEMLENARPMDTILNSSQSLFIPWNYWKTSNNSSVQETSEPYQPAHVKRPT